jgi:SAM-dependent methyltransferase
MAGMSEADRDRWNARYRAAGAGGRGPSRFLVQSAALLPRAGRALDVAGGAGVEAVWLAGRGLDVTLVDVSDEALAIARAAAAAAGVALRLERRDLEADGLPGGPFDAVVCLNYLQRSLFEAWGRTLAPGGRLVFLQPTKRNLERHAHPSERFLLADGELGGLVRGLEVERLEEGWWDDGEGVERHVARLVARRPGPAGRGS